MIRFRDLDQLRWGPQYFTEKSLKKQAVNCLGHVGIGLLSGCLAAPFVIYLGVHPSVMVGSAFLFGLTREGRQWAKSGKPHVLDRARDIVECTLGGVAGLGIWMAS